MKQRIPLAMGLLGLAIVGVFIWLLIQQNNVDLTDPAAYTGKERGTSDSPLTLSEQTPRIQTEPEADDSQQDEQANQGAAATGKYKFVTWNDALNEYAQRLGLVYDRLTAAGDPSPVLNANRIADAEMENDPEFFEAMMLFMPFGEPIPKDEWHLIPNPDPNDRIPMKIWENPIWMLVIAGRLPEGSQHARVPLPNGKIFYLEGGYQLEVYWKERHIPIETESGRQRAETLQKRERELSKLAEASQGEERANAEERLALVQSAIKRLHTAHIINFHNTVGGNPLRPGHPDYKPKVYEVIELDLGLLPRNSGVDESGE